MVEWSNTRPSVAFSIHQMGKKTHDVIWWAYHRQQFVYVIWQQSASSAKPTRLFSFLSHTSHCKKKKETTNIVFSLPICQKLTLWDGCRPVLPSQRIIIWQVWNETQKSKCLSKGPLKKEFCCFQTHPRHVFVCKWLLHNKSFGIGPPDSHGSNCSSCQTDTTDTTDKLRLKHDLTKETIPSETDL